MFSRSINRSIPKIRSHLTVRRFAVRQEYDSPFDYLPKSKKKPFINWKTTAIFVAIGSYLSYSEFFLDKYADFTEINEDNDLLSIQLQYRLTQLPIYQRIVHSRDADNWTKLETWEDLDHNILDKQDFNHDKWASSKGENATDHLSHTLAKPGGFLIKPLIFHNSRTGEGVTILHAGYRLCGYPFIIHGGILATILNETFKRNAALSKDTTSTFKGDFKVENLSITYKYPSFANQFLIIKTKQVPLEKADGDKLFKFESTIESESGKLLVKSEAVLHDTGLFSNSQRPQSFKSLIGL